MTKWEVIKMGDHYWKKFCQSEWDIYFKCDKSKCKNFGMRLPYYSVLEMYSEYCPIDCDLCKEKMILTLEYGEEIRNEAYGLK